MAEQPKANVKAAPKRTANARRKPTPRRRPAITVAPKQPGPDFATRAQQTGRKVFLAGLGFYGKAYDHSKASYSSLQKQLKGRRKQADRLYQELVKRGEKVEQDARVALEDLDLPTLEVLTNRKQLAARLDKARARVAALKESVGLKSAA